jgi:putative oxidoreductase
VGFLEKLKPFSLLVLRCAVGAIFILHGYPKFAHGIGNTENMMTGFGLPAYFAYLAIVLELGGSVLLILGVFTRPLGLLFAIEMGVAVKFAGMGHGIFALKDYQLPLLLGAASLALATTGAGMVSVDELLFGGKAKPKPKPKP